MYHKQLVDHILNNRKKGSSDEEMRADLSKDGWSKEDIDLSFQYAKSPEKLKRISLERLLNSEVKSSYFIAVFLTAIAISVWSFVYVSKKDNTYKVVVSSVPGDGRPNFTYGIQPVLSRPDFFNKVKNQFIDTKATFVEVDLTQMIARVYKDGNKIVEVPVKTKGRSGSWWETPAGLYKIETKEKTHYSTIGHVTQPWSMEFQGNFFIHGIPYYENGKQVATTFSGGCIRLADDDAKKIFDAVTIGTPILVYEKDFSPDSFSYTAIQPETNAKSFLYADLNNNFVFLEKNDEQKLPIGAVAKLMTALIATEYINIERTTIVGEESLVPSDTPRLSADMKIDIYQLLFPLLRESSNEAGEVIARTYGRSQFIRNMNNKAKAIGMVNTKFVDPTGVSPDTISTAGDIFMLAKYIYNNRSFIFNITSGKVKTNTYGESIFKDLGWSNSFSGQDNFFGGIGDEKDGELQSNLSVLHVTTSSGIRPIVFVSLFSTNAKRDIEGGLKYIMSSYK